MNRLATFILGISCAISATVAPVYAARGQGTCDTPATSSAGITGRARVYDYRRWHDDNQPYPTQDSNSQHDTQATAVGGDLLLKSPSLCGFSAAASIYTQQSLIDYAEPNTVMVPRHLTQIAEAYLQFQASIAQLKGGRQTMNTPFANSDMFTMLTRSFSGYSAAIHLLDSGVRPVPSNDDEGPSSAPPSAFDPSVLMPFAHDTKPGKPDLKLYVARMTSYLSRFADTFTDANRYSVGLNAANPAIPTTTPGLFTAGLQYQQGLGAGDVMARAWDYTFFNYADLQYYEGGFQARALIASGRPYLKLQYAHETESGAAYAGIVDATYYGAKLGLNFSKLNIALVWAYAPSHPGSFRNGSLLHPYSDFSHVLYDDTLNNGLEDLGPGRAIGIQGKYEASDSLTLKAKLVHYIADYGTNGAFYTYDGPAYFAGIGLANGTLVPDQSSNGLDLGAVYSMTNAFSIADDVGLRSGFGGRNTFVVDRFRLVYSF